MINALIRDEILAIKCECEKAKIKLEKDNSKMSAYRFVVFVLGICLLLIGLSDGIFVAGLIGTLLLLGFVGLIKLHSNITNELKLVCNKLTSIDAYLARYGEEWRNFEDDGEEFLSKNMTLARDVDLLGKASLYQLINVCHTELGRKKLADRMLNMTCEDSLELNKQAVEELLKDTNAAIEYEGLGISLQQDGKKFYREAFAKACNIEKKDEIPFWMTLLGYVLPVFELVSIVLAMFGIIKPVSAIAGFIILLGYSELTKTTTLGSVLPICSICPLLDNYILILKQISEGNYESKLLLELQRRAQASQYAFSKLGIVSQVYNLYYNPFLYIVMNGFFLWNFRLSSLANRWRKRYSGAALDCFEVIGELEYLQSLAALARTRSVCWADISYEEKAKVSLDGKDLYHPLISPEKVVVNDVSLKGGITVITGSNMSGKTTLLRTLAINLVLGYMGAPVCGKKLRADYMKLFTSMRVMDNVAGGISTFYAEILRIKDMADYRGNNKPMLCLIDEIFKGTNSADRIVGASEVIKRLSGSKAIVVVSTHDFELCDLKDENGTEASNFHFEEYYENESLKFDYKMKQGRCTTTNAKAILRMAGFNV